MKFITAIKNITENLDTIITAANDTIWEYGELYFEEHQSCDYLLSVTEKFGFETQKNICGLETAFVAKWGTIGPKIAFLAEYDALPGLNQQANCLQKQPQEGKTQNDSGHGCGHNSLGAGSLGAALALKEYCIQEKIDAQIYLLGCPAEENGSGKMFMAREGLFSEMDVCITWHPATANAVVGDSSLACLSAQFTFHGVTSHAAATPHLGRSALDACELMNVGVNYLREHIIPEARVHYSYLETGAKAPNVVQDIASTFYFIRAPKVSQALEIAQRVYDIAQGAALMTGTTVDILKLDGLCDYIPNKTLGELGAEIFAQVGAPVWAPAHYQLAQQYAETFDVAEIAFQKEDMAKAHHADKSLYQDQVLDSLVAPYTHQPYKVSPGSTDVGDVSYCCPTLQFGVACVAIGTPGHSWQMTGQSASIIAHQGTVTAAQVMAATAAQLLHQPHLLQQAKKEYLQSVPQGYICPAPADLQPTIAK